MALAKQDREFLRTLNRRVADRALEPEDPLYQPIYQQLDADDPVAMMQQRIELSDVQTMQLFSGFSGSGKTTELFRLRRDLRMQGYIVLYADALDYMNEVEPLPIADMLMLAAGAFSDALENDLQIDLRQQNFWARLTAFVQRTELSITGGDVKAEYSSPGQGVLGGLKAGLNIKAELKTGSSFRRDLQKFLSNHLVQLQRDVHQFFEDGAKAVWANHGEDTQIVFILDQLERLRGDYRNWQGVIRSAQQLFTVQLDRLRMPYVHCIYSVPAWLSFVPPRPPNLTLLPTVQLWNRGQERQPCERGETIFRGLIDRRLPAADAGRVFGEKARQSIEQLLAACGGHIRDLLRMFQEVLARANTLPVDGSVVERVIAATRRDFLPLAVDDARLLHDISLKQNLEPDTLDEASIERLSRFFNTHLVMYFEDRQPWYDTHPLIRDEVARIVRDSEPDE